MLRLITDDKSHAAACLHAINPLTAYRHISEMLTYRAVGSGSH